MTAPPLPHPALQRPAGAARPPASLGGEFGTMTPRPARTVPAHPGESHKAIDVTASRF